MAKARHKGQYNVGQTGHVIVTGYVTGQVGQVLTGHDVVVAVVGHGDLVVGHIGQPGQNLSGQFGIGCVVGQGAHV